MRRADTLLTCRVEREQSVFAAPNGHPEAVMQFEVTDVIAVCHSSPNSSFL